MNLSAKHIYKKPVRFQTVLLRLCCWVLQEVRKYDKNNAEFLSFLLFTYLLLVNGTQGLKNSHFLYGDEYTHFPTQRKT